MTDIANIMIATTAAKPTIPIPEASESGEAAEAQAPNGYTIGLDDRGWHFITPLGAKSRPWNDRRSAVDGAFDHVENRSPYATESVDTKTRAAPDGWVIQPLEPGRWSIRRIYQERLDETFVTRQGAVDAAWRYEIEERTGGRGEPYRDPPEGYSLSMSAEGPWVVRQNLGKMARTLLGHYPTRQDAVDAAWKHEVDQNDAREEPRVSQANVAAVHRSPKRKGHGKPRAVVLESPYRGKDSAETAENESYARRAMSDCIRKGEAPFASHLLYTQAGVLDDAKAEERERGIEAGYLIGRRLGTVVFYMDRGMSPGMVAALEHYTRSGHAIEFRYLDLLDEDDL